MFAETPSGRRIWVIWRYDQEDDEMPDVFGERTGMFTSPVAPLNPRFRFELFFMANHGPKRARKFPHAVAAEADLLLPDRDFSVGARGLREGAWADF